MSFRSEQPWKGPSSIGLMAIPEMPEEENKLSKKEVKTKQTLVKNGY